MTRRLDRRQFLMAAAGLVAAGAVARSADMKGDDEVVFVLDCSPEACGAVFGSPEDVEDGLEEREEDPRDERLQGA